MKKQERTKSIPMLWKWLKRELKSSQNLKLLRDVLVLPLLVMNPQAKQLEAASIECARYAGLIYLS